MARPAVDAALRFLRVGLARGVLRDGDRLPTIVELARQARVSGVSMSKAVATLVQEGLLDARRGRGIVLSRDRAAPALAARAPTRPERLANDIIRRLLSGAYGPSHVVPSLKELQASYGAGFRSVKRALESLRRGGLLVPHGRGYCMRGPAATPIPKTLVFIVGREMHENLRWSYARSFFYPLLYALERECSQRNVRLEVEQYPWRMTELVRRAGTVAHFVALDGKPDAETIRLISHLLTLGPPVLVFRDHAHAAFQALPASKSLLFFDCSELAAGHHVGRRLLALGHRRVCYLRQTPPQPWCMERLSGLERAFGLAAERGAVTVVDLEATGAAPNLRSTRRAVSEWTAKLLSLSATGAVTAWVASNDHLVIDRLVPALGRRGMTLAQAPSIVSFNDQAEAFDHKLTSYNFNGPGLAAAVVSHAVVPAALRRAQRARDPVVHVDGYLVDRGSLRAAR
jgi:DNA-binding transcriptional regulator YhcF (GntR family)/DNA-binding LacI/PurR family transcriptional regulator